MYSTWINIQHINFDGKGVRDITMKYNYTVLSLSVEIVINMYYCFCFFFQSKDAFLFQNSLSFMILTYFLFVFVLQNASETKKFSDAEEEIPLQKGPEWGIINQRRWCILRARRFFLYRFITARSQLWCFGSRGSLGRKFYSSWP